MPLKHLPLTLFLFVLISLTACSKNNPVKTEPTTLKDEAKSFALDVVKSYISNDTLTFKSYLGDTLYSLEAGDKPIPVDSISVSDLFSRFDYSAYSMNDYLDVYEPIIMDYDAYSKVNPGWLDQFIYWHPDNQDFLFFGSREKQGKQGFMWDDLLGFMVSKRSGHWVLRTL